MLAAHGSPDPRFAATVEALATLVSTARPAVSVAIGYLEHGPPDLRTVADAESIIVPLLLTSGFHVRTDIPSQAPRGTVARPLGPDPRIAGVLTRRLREAGWRGESPVALAATGSSDPRALDDVRQMAALLTAALGVAVTAAFLSDGSPQLADIDAGAVATYLLAPGRFADVVASNGAPIVAAPLGADSVLADIVLDRYDDARRARG